MAIQFHRDSRARIYRAWISLGSGSLPYYVVLNSELEVECSFLYRMGLAFPLP